MSKPAKPKQKQKNRQQAADDDDSPADDNDDLLRLAAMQQTNASTSHKQANKQNTPAGVTNHHDDEHNENDQRSSNKQNQQSQKQKQQQTHNKQTGDERHKQQQQKKKNEEEPAEQEHDEDDDESEEFSASTSHSRPHPKDPKRIAAREEWLDKMAAKQAKRYAGTTERGKVVTVKQERQKVARDAEVSSGVASALQQLSLKKKQKQQMKKKKKQQQQQEQEEEESSEEEEQEEAEGGPEEEPEDEDAQQGDEEESAEASGQPEDEDDEVDVDDAVVHYESLDEEVAAYRERHHITLYPTLDTATDAAALSSSLYTDPLFFPVRSFSELHSQYSVPSVVTASLFLSSFRSPTPIQAQVWSVVFAGKDVVGVAETGSGKTLAFLLGAIIGILKKKGWIKDMQQKEAQQQTWTPPTISTSTASSSSTTTITVTSIASPVALILSPTRELALQTFDVANSSCSSLGLRVLSMVGGPSIEGQTALLLTPVDMVVATPGRLLKLVAARAITLSSVSYFVLDEADRMLDLGFHDAIRSLVSGLTATHQTLLFSATWPPTVTQVASSIVRPDKTIKVTIGSADLAAAKSVTQHVEVIDRRNGGREKRILQLLQQHPPSPSQLILIFTLYKRESQQLAEYLSRHHHPAQALNSDKTQQQRVSILSSFRAGRVPILVATDVAARGLDVRNVKAVINFSMGLSVEHYIHRIGRCGRGGQSGIAYTFFVDYDLSNAVELIRVLEDSHAEVSPELRELGVRAQRRAQKHKEEGGVRGDALVALRMKNRDAKQMTQKEIEEQAAEDAVFGAEDEMQETGKSQHAQTMQSKGKKQQNQRQRGGKKGGR